MQIAEGVLVAVEFFRFLSACRIVAVDDDVVFVKLDKLSSVAADGHARAGLYETMQRYRRVLARFDCVDCEFRSAVHVAADENVGFRRLIGQRIRNGIITVMELNLRAFQPERISRARSRSKSAGGLVNCLESRKQLKVAQ